MDRSKPTFALELFEHQKAQFNVGAYPLRYTFLKYYQQLACDIVRMIKRGVEHTRIRHKSSDSSTTLDSTEPAIYGSRGALIVHGLGMGKSVLAPSIACELNENERAQESGRHTILLMAKSLHYNAREGLVKYAQLRYAEDPSWEHGKDAQAINKWIARNYSFVSINASNMIQQLNRARPHDPEDDEPAKSGDSRDDIADDNNINVIADEIDNPIDEFEAAENLLEKNLRGVLTIESLKGKILIIDEAHIWASAVTNGAKNALALYKAIMSERDLYVFYLTGTPIVNDGFELVPYFNTISIATKAPLFPENEQLFADAFVNSDGTIRNKGKFQNRINGLVSFASLSDTFAKGIIDSLAQDGDGEKPDSSSHRRTNINDRSAELEILSSFPSMYPEKSVYVHMDNTQYDAYKAAVEIEKKEESRNFGNRGTGSGGKMRQKSDKISTYRVRSRQLSNAYYDIHGKLHSAKADKLIELSDIHDGYTGMVFSTFTGKGGAQPISDKLVSTGKWVRFVPTTSMDLRASANPRRGGGEDSYKYPKSKAEQILEAERFMKQFKDVTITDTPQPSRKIPSEVTEGGDYADDDASDDYAFSDDDEECGCGDGVANVGGGCDIDEDIAIFGGDAKTPDDNDLSAFDEYVDPIESNQPAHPEHLLSTLDKVAIETRKEKAAQGNKKHPKVFAIVTGQTPPEEVEEILRVVKSKENARGELIAMIMVSKVMAAGVNLKNITWAVILEPHWNEGLTNQAKGRIRRPHALDNLNPDERYIQIYSMYALPPKSLMKPEDLVRLYPDEASKYKNAPKEGSKRADGSTVVYESFETTDVELNRRAKRKSTINAHFLDCIQQVSIECLANNGFDSGKCRACMDNGKRLFTDDFAADMAALLVDPCEPAKVVNFSVKKVHLGDDLGDIYYREVSRTESIYGIRLYRRSVSSGSYILVSELEPDYFTLVATVKEIAKEKL